MTILVVDNGSKDLEELAHQLVSEGHVVSLAASTGTGFRIGYPKWDINADEAFAGSNVIITSNHTYNQRWALNSRGIPVVFLRGNTQ